MRNKLHELMMMSTIMSTMADIGEDPWQTTSGGGLTKKEIAKVNGKLPQKPIPKGHQKFIIEGVTIWALNEKNARKKYNKTHRL